MGCSGHKSGEINDYLRIYISTIRFKTLVDKLFTLFNNFTLKNKISKTKIGIYTSFSFFKKKKSKIIFKRKSQKIFLVYSREDRSKVNKVNAGMDSMYNMNKEMKKYDSRSLDYFSPYTVFNTNYTEIINELNIKDADFLICFINSSFIPKEVYTKGTKISSLIIYDLKDKPKDDKYHLCNGYTLVFKDSTIHSFILNKHVTQGITNTTTKTKDQIKQDVNNIILTLKNKNIIQYEISYQTYRIGDSEYCSNIYIVTDTPSLHALENEITTTPEVHLTVPVITKFDIYKYIDTEIKSVDNSVVINIEVFKEKKWSFLFNIGSTNKKLFTIKLSRTNKIKEIEKLIAQTLNPFITAITKSRYYIVNLVMLPNDNSIITSNKNDIVIAFKYTKCFKYVYENIITRYKQIFHALDILCFLPGEKVVEDANEYLDVKFINEHNDIFFTSFITNSFSAHVFIKLQEHKIVFSEYFKNTASVYFNNLNDNARLKMIPKPEFKSDVLKPFTEDSTSFFPDESVFFNQEKINLNKQYIVNANSLLPIYFQPGHCIKYNKYQNQIKSYSINQIKYVSEGVLFTPLNEISSAYNVKEDLVSGISSDYIKCSECNVIGYSTVSKEGHYYKFNFYICPVTHNIFCKTCSYTDNVYNGLYVNCVNKDVLRNAPSRNGGDFKSVDDVKLYPEVLDNICDICKVQLSQCKKRKNQFWSGGNVGNKNNPFLVCQGCFETFIDCDYVKWEIDERFSFVKEILDSEYIDLDNVILKRIVY